MAASELLMNIGDRLRERREEMKLTQKQAAKLLEMSETFYGEVERGNKRLSLEKIVMVRERMELDITYLLTGKVARSQLLSEVYRRCPAEKVETMKKLIECLTDLCG